MQGKCIKCFLGPVLILQLRECWCCYYDLVNASLPPVILLMSRLVQQQSQKQLRVVAILAVDVCGAQETGSGERERHGQVWRLCGMLCLQWALWLLKFLAAVVLRHS